MNQKACSKASLEHTGVCKGGLGISSDISVGKFEHEAIDFLSLSRQTERLQEKSQSIDERDIAEVQLIDKGMHDGDVLLLTGQT